MDPLTMGAISLGSGLLTGLFGSGESDKEKAINDWMKKMQADKATISSTAYSKDEIMNNIIPMLQQMLKGSANVAAGQIGASIGESGSGMGGGQNFGEYYTQALAPVIAQGQQSAANATQNMMDMFAKMDDASKNRLLQYYQLQLQGASQKADTNATQRFFTNTIQGMNLGANIMGSLAQANYMFNKDKVTPTPTPVVNQNFGGDIGQQGAFMSSLNKSVTDNMYNTKFGSI